MPRYRRFAAALHTAAAVPSTALLLGAATALAPAVPVCSQAIADAPPLAALFDTVPADAEVIWAVPTLRGFSDRIATFAAETGLGRHAPDLADALDAFKREMGLNQGLDDDGPLLVAVSGLAAAMDAALDDNPNNDNLEPSAVLLVPVSDYTAFVTELGGDPAAAATPITLNGSNGFARKVPGYAVIAPTAEAAEAYAPGGDGAALTEAVGPHPAPWFEHGQSLIYVDVAALAPSLKSAIQQGVAEVMENDAQRERSFGPMADVMPTIMTAQAGFLTSLIDGTNKLTLTLDLDGGGLGLTAGGRLNAGSEMAKMLRPGDGAEGGAPLLTRMPDQPYLFAAAANLTRLDTAALSDAMRGVAAELKVAAGGADAAGGLPIEQIVDLYTEMLQVAPDATAMGSVMYAPAPAAMMGGGFFNQLSVTRTADAEGALDRQQAVMAKMNDLTIPLPPVGAGAEPGSMSFETTYTKKALEIEGTRVDQFQVKTVLPPALMQQFGPMAMVMGNAGSGGYVAAKDGHVLSTTVTDPQLVTRGLKALEADDGLGASAMLTDLRATELPADAALEAWLSVRGIANTVNPFLMMFAQGGEQLEVPADLSPVALGAAGDPEGLVLRLFVPTDVVRFGVDTVNQFAPEADGGDNGGRGRRAPRAL